MPAKAASCSSCDYDNCPVIFALNLLSKKWLVPIICALHHNEVMRFGELSRALMGITDMMLTQCLKELQRFGIVNRVQYNEMPLRVEYSLTEMGQDMVPSILSLSKWSPQILDQPADILSCPHTICSAKVVHTVQMRQKDIANIRRNWDEAYEDIYAQLTRDDRHALLDPLEKMMVNSSFLIHEKTGTVPIQYRSSFYPDSNVSNQSPSVEYALVRWVK